MVRVRALLAFVPLLLAVSLAGSAPGALAPPRLLGLGISNGGKPFAGDTRQLATVSPNGDGLRDRALVRFHLDQAATVQMQIVATTEARRPPKIVSRTRRRFSAGPHTIVWTPKRGTPDRTYLLRFVVKGQAGKRVHGLAGPPPGPPTRGRRLRILGLH